jgi:hypothetical protein
LFRVQAGQDTILAVNSANDMGIAKTKQATKRKEKRDDCIVTVVMELF